MIFQWLRFALCAILMLVGLIAFFAAAFGAGDWTRVGATGFLLLTAVALILFTFSKVFGGRKAAVYS